MSRFRLLPELVLDPRLVTVLLTLAATLLPVALVAAATSPLGFTLGQTTLAEVERLLPRDKIKQRTGRALLEFDPAAFAFDGLEQVALVLDGDQHLAMVLLTFAKHQLRDVLADLRAKYSVDRQSIDNFMQNGRLLFRSANNWIYLDAPHLSFSFKLLCVTDELWRDTVRDIQKSRSQEAPAGTGQAVMRCPPAAPRPCHPSSAGAWS